MQKKLRRVTPAKQYRIKRLKARWPAWVALFVTSLLYEALPKVFYWGPEGLMISLVVLLAVPMILISYWHEHSYISRILSLSVTTLITLYMIISVGRVVQIVFEGHIGPAHLIWSSVALWATNILVFALWYWNLDAGGPGQREQRDSLRMTAFLFPQAQIALTKDADELPPSIINWQPQFIDYLFLAFNTSTAFSPTDSPVLNRWAKAMLMIQSLISLTIILMLAARAISIINTGSYLVS